MGTNNLTEELELTQRYFHEEMSALRLGRAHPGLVENVMVNYYGTPTALKQLASVTVSDAQTLVIQPWDKNAFKDVEQALQKANLGASPTSDGNVLRIIIPQMTEERRLAMVKKVHEIAEKYKVRIRQTREEHNKMNKKDKEAGTISEDQLFNRQKELQNEIDTAIEALSAVAADKEKEITTV